MATSDGAGQTVSFRTVLEEELRDPEFRAIWERLAPARAVANRVVGYRIDHGLTQTALARKLGMSQPAVARLEDGEHLPSIETLVRLAERLGMSFQVEIRPAGTAEHRTDSSDNGTATTVEHVTSQNGAVVLFTAA
jgi:transcriptional regulator with XRE-family HTH domain